MCIRPADVCPQIEQFDHPAGDNKIRDLNGRSAVAMYSHSLLDRQQVQSIGRM
jgi:hypothetical protein